MVEKQQQWASVKQIARIYPAFSEAGLRWLIFNSKTNHFDQCLRRIGRRVLININDFEQFIENHKGGVQ